MKGLEDLFKQAQAAQSKMAEAQEEMKVATVTGEAGAGMVKVTLNGCYEALRVEIDAEAIGDDFSGDKRAVVEELVAAAFNDGVRGVEQMRQEKMSSLMGALGLPPGIKLPF